MVIRVNNPTIVCANHQTKNRVGQQEQRQRVRRQRPLFHTTSRLEAGAQQQCAKNNDRGFLHVVWVREQHHRHIYRQIWPHGMCPFRNTQTRINTQRQERRQEKVQQCRLWAPVRRFAPQPVHKRHNARTAHREEAAQGPVAYVSLVVLDGLLFPIYLVVVFT